MRLFSCPMCEAKVSEITLTDPLFIADLHLSDDAPHTTARFLSFLATTARKHEELVILGDFFAYWVGDDTIDTAQEIVDALKGYAAEKKLYVMQGNRDFMIGETFAQTVGATLIADPTRATLGETTLLLSHGDIWCTNDEKYQKARRRVRSFWWQWLVLRLSKKKRLAIAEDAKRKSKLHKKDNHLQTMDAVDEVVVAAARNAGANWVIHGHTHQPAVHVMADGIERWVLPDWNLDEEPHRGGWIAFEDGKPQFERL